MPRLVILASLRKILLLVLVLALAWSCAEVFELPGPRLAPRIRSVAPGLGTEGTRVLISGKNFSRVPGNNQVKFNGQTATVVAATDTQLVAQVPAHAGTGPVEVVVGNLAAEGPEFLFFETPIVRDITPKEGVPGTEVVIKGQYFDTTTTHNTVQFGGKTATVLPPAFDSLLRVSVPSDAQSGLVTVTVNGFTGTGPRFTVIGTNEPVLTITGIAPTSGTAGTAVTITGENFSTVNQNNTVRFNGKVANVQSALSNKLVVVVPEAAGTGVVSVTVNGKTANGPVFTYIDNTPAPAISNYDPNLGKAGDLIAIVGTNFSPVAGSNVVKFNGVTATVVSPATATLLKATVPQGASTGPVTVTVGTKTGTGPVFTVLDNSPTIADFNPKQGPVGTQVLITGNNFGIDPAVITVKFNGVTARVQEAGGTTLVLDVPAGATTGKITVTVAGKTATSTVDFVVTGTQTNSWKLTGAMSAARNSHTATLLPDGRVLVTGGLGVVNNYSVSLATCEIYDPATGQWNPTGSMKVGRWRHSATLLANGKVLVTGGRSYDAGGVQTSSEIYDPATGQWTPTGPMQNARILHKAILLKNNKVLVVGGTSETYYGIHSACELYDPATGEWTITGYLSQARITQAMSLLPDGRVLAAGGFTNVARGTGVLETCEIYDPVTGTWTATTSMPAPRGHVQGFTLADGSVIVVGGESITHQQGMKESYLYNSARASWSTVVSLVAGRSEGFAAVVLSDGSILVTGGGEYTNYSTSERLDPVTGSNTVANMIYGRAAHTVTLLKNGQVLAVGSGPNSSCEIYTP